VAHHSTLGSKLGPRIADIVVKAMVSHLRDSADLRAQIHKAGLDAFWDGLGTEAQNHLAPIWRSFGAAPDMPDHLKAMAHFAAEGSGEWSAALNLLGAQAAGQSGFGALFSNAFAPFTQHALALSPALLLPYSTYVQLALARTITPQEVWSRGARQGMMTPDLEALLEATWQRPDVAQLIELWRRGIIDGGRVAHQLRRQGWEEDAIGEVVQLKREHLGPPDLALAVLRGHLSEQDGRAGAAIWGIEPGDFDTLLYNTGEPPSPQSMMEALRRGFIDQPTFGKAIRQSRIRDEWIPLMERLRFSPMATADAVEAVVRNYITPDEGKAIAEQNGLEPEHWSTLLLAHGRPPGHAQMLQLLNRGLVSEAQVDQAVRESDVKDKYVPMLQGLRWRIPTERLLVTLVQHNAMPVARAHELLQKEGFEPDVAGSIIKAGTAQRTTGHKQIALATVEQLYEAHAISEAQAVAHIEALGYPKEDAPLVLRSAELKRELKWRDALIAAARTGFLGHHTSQEEVAAELAAGGIPSEQIAHLLALWVVERQAHRRTLTEAQIIHAHRAGHIDAGEAQQRLEGIGYGPNDALFLVETSGPLPKGA
jgi:hypothetical protein